MQNKTHSTQKSSHKSISPKNSISSRRKISALNFESFSYLTHGNQTHLHQKNFNCPLIKPNLKKKLYLPTNKHSTFNSNTTPLSYYTNPTRISKSKLKLSNISTSPTKKKEPFPIQNDSYFIEIIKEKDKEIEQLKIELSNLKNKYAYNTCHTIENEINYNYNKSNRLLNGKKKLNSSENEKNESVNNTYNSLFNCSNRNNSVKYKNIRISIDTPIIETCNNNNNVKVRGELNSFDEPVKCIGVKQKCEDGYKKKFDDMKHRVKNILQKYKGFQGISGVNGFVNKNKK